MAFLFTNKAITFLNSNLSSVSTTIVLAGGEGVKFPAPTNGDVASLILEDRLTGEFEIIYLTGRTGDQLSVSRGQEGTAPISWPQGTSLSLRTTAAALNNLGPLQEGVDANAAAIVDLQGQVDAISEAILQSLYPVGSLYFSTLATNPSSLLGFGTWAQYAAGRAIVGVGSNGETSWAVNQERGAEEHTLVVDELPAHTHGAGALQLNEAGAHTHTVNYEGVNSSGSKDVGGGSQYNRQQLTATTSGAGAHTHAVSGNTASAGGGQPHNNVQPSIGVYIWRRTT